MRRRLTFLPALVVAAATSCGNVDEASPPTTTAPPDSASSDRAIDAATIIPSPDVEGTDPSPPGSNSPAGNGDAFDATLVEAEPFEVGDGRLPTEIVNAYVNAGGDLVTPGEWERRFGTPAGFPELRGESARVVEALYRVEVDADGWLRTDELSWLVVDDRHRDDLLADLAARLGSGGDLEATNSSQQGAECAVAHIPSIGDWTVQGCSYSRFTDLIAVGVTRTATSTDEPEVVDTTVVTVAATLGGRPVFTEVRLGSPSPDGSTLHLATQTRFDQPIDVDAATEQLLADALQGWQVLRGDGSVLLSGPTGGTWTITPTVAVFEWAGRW